MYFRQFLLDRILLNSFAKCLMISKYHFNSPCPMKRMPNDSVDDDDDNESGMCDSSLLISPFSTYSAQVLSISFEGWIWVEKANIYQME